MHIFQSKTGERFFNFLIPNAQFLLPVPCNNLGLESIFGFSILNKCFFHKLTIKFSSLPSYPFKGVLPIHALFELRSFLCFGLYNRWSLLTRCFVIQSVKKLKKCKILFLDLLKQWKDVMPPWSSDFQNSRKYLGECR